MKVKDLENSPLIPSEAAPEEGGDVENPNDASPDGIGENQKGFHPMLAIIIVLVVLLVAVLGIVVFVRNGGEEKEVCKTNECLTLTTSMLNWRNPHIDPCDDFYEYTCGNYSVHSGTDGTRIVEKELIVRKLITELVHKNGNSTSKSENTLKLLYWKCMELKDTDIARSKEEDTYHEVFRQIQQIGPWPTALGKKWNNESFELNEVLANMARLHMMEFGLFELVLLEHPSFGTVKQLVIVPATTKLTLPKDEMMEVTQNLLFHNGIHPRKAQLTADIQKFYDLDHRFRRHVPIQWNVPDVTYSEIQKRIPSVDFDKIIRNLLPSGGSWDNLKSKIRSRRFSGFYAGKDNTERLIKETSKRDMANYLIFKYIEFGYSYITMRKQVVDPRPCDELIINILPRAALRIFVRHYFKSKNLRVAEQMVKDIKETYLEMIRDSTWLDEQTKKYAIEKVKLMRTMIGYTKDYEEKGRLDAIFKSLPVQPSDSFYTLFTKVQRFRTEQLIEYILKDDALLNPIDALVVANAFYFPLKNSLNILVPFLDKPLFEASYPKYVNAAGVGRVLAHEVGHAFDKNGRVANHNGTLGEWWTIGDEDEYDEKAQCLIDQYDSFIDPDHKRPLNGTQVINEMIADLLGTEAAWRTYKKLDMSEELGLFKFEDRTPDELYFHVAALDFCAPPDKRHVLKALEMKHPTSRFRVNGVFQNLKAFADTFKCPVGSKMNPGKRCSLF